MTLFSFIVSSKLEQTYSNGVFQQISSLYFIPEIVVFAKTGFVCQNIFRHPFLPSVVKEAESWVCYLPKALLLVANEPLLRLPKQSKALFLQNCNQTPNHPLSILLLIF